MCSALQFIHSHDPPVYHRDIKSLNFLVTKDWRVRLGDLGLARAKTDTNMETMSRTVGTYGYCPPGTRLVHFACLFLVFAPHLCAVYLTFLSSFIELYYGKEYTELSDMYSMGILLWEMVYRLVKGTALSTLAPVFSSSSSSTTHPCYHHLFFCFLTLALLFRPIPDPLRRVPQAQGRLPNLLSCSREGPASLHAPRHPARPATADRAAVVREAPGPPHRSVDARSARRVPPGVSEGRTGVAHCARTHTAAG